MDSVIVNKITNNVFEKLYQSVDPNQIANLDEVINAFSAILVKAINETILQTTEQCNYIQPRYVSETVCSDTDHMIVIKKYDGVKLSIQATISSEGLEKDATFCFSHWNLR